MDMVTIQNGLQIALQMILNAFMVGAFMWIVGSILYVFPKILSNKSIKLVNLLLAAVVVVAVLFAILMGPMTTMKVINESYQMTMPEMAIFKQNVLDDIVNGYETDYTVVGTAIAAPILTATPDVNADGGAALPEPTATITATVAMQPTAVAIEPTATPLPTATATPVVTIAPTFDYSTWLPGTPAPTPIIGE